MSLPPPALQTAPKAPETPLPAVDGAAARVYARRLLASLEAYDAAATLAAEADDVNSAKLAAAINLDWAQSGLMHLTGQAAGPPLRGGHAVPSCARGALLALRTLARRRLPEDLDGARLLTERSALAGLRRRGAISANGSCRILDAGNGLLAINLPREDDWSLLPAWLQVSGLEPGWEALASALRRCDVADLVARGALLGLAVSAPPSPGEIPRHWYRLDGSQSALAAHPREGGPVVIDLASLWAGPLCSRLLQLAGARVIKVESSQRPDGTRGGDPRFFNLLNAGKDSVLLDFGTDAGRAQLRALLERADIVVEGSRPRALRQLGIDAMAMVRQRPGLIWVSLTGHGRAGEEGNRVAFGDDAAVAAGLCVETDGGAAVFCGDALCDPLAGLHAAVAAQALWRSARGGLLDISLRGVGAFCRRGLPRGDTQAARRRGGRWWLDTPAGALEVLPPRPRAMLPATAPLGADTGSVLAEFGIPC